MKQINFNNYKDKMTQNDLDQIFELLSSGLRSKNRELLRTRLNRHINLIPQYGILERLIKENGDWRYFAGQSYPDEIRTLRNIILNLK